MATLKIGAMCSAIDACPEPIDAIEISNSLECDLLFECSAVLVHGPALILPGGKNISVSPGDFALFRRVSSGIRCMYVMRADGRSVAEAAGSSVPVATLQRIDALEQQVQQLAAICRQHEQDRAELLRICQALDERIDTVKLMEAA